MPGIEQTYNRIIAYLKGILSERQRHELEKDLMRDAFEDDAFEGLSQLSADELEADMKVMMDRIENRVSPVKKRDLKYFLRLAAGIMLMIGLGISLYFIFRTPSSGLLTQEKERGKSSVPNAPAGAPQPIQADTLTKNIKPFKKRLNHRTEHPVTLAENPTGARKSKTKGPLAEVFTARVVDSEGKALSGINVVEKGSNLSTITDKNGRFSLPLNDTGSILSLHHTGFKPSEFRAGKNPGETITIQDDLLAMDEVVVVGYENEKKDNIQGVVPTVKNEDISTTAPKISQALEGKAAGVQVTQRSYNEADNLNQKKDVDLNNLVSPLPPGGTLKDFKKWVTDRLDNALFKPYPGKQRILVNLTVNSDGTISDIRIKDNVPATIAAEFKKVIAQSPRWNPALRDDIPVDAQVAIRFIITVE